MSQSAGRGPSSFSPTGCQHSTPPPCISALAPCWLPSPQHPCWPAVLASAPPLQQRRTGFSCSLPVRSLACRRAVCTQHGPRDVLRPPWPPRDASFSVPACCNVLLEGSVERARAVSRRVSDAGALSTRVHPAPGAGGHSPVTAALSAALLSLSEAQCCVRVRSDTPATHGV